MAEANGAAMITSSPVIAASTAPIPTGSNEKPPANPLTERTKTASGNDSCTPIICAVIRTTKPSANRATAVRASPLNTCLIVNPVLSPSQRLPACGARCLPNLDSTSREFSMTMRLQYFRVRASAAAAPSSGIASQAERI
jgi:hypothetical protein